jgi:hypothetical protein
MRAALVFRVAGFEVAGMVADESEDRIAIESRVRENLAVEPTVSSIFATQA